MQNTLTLTKAKQAFYLAAQIEGRSQRTIELYEASLKMFGEFLDGNDPVEATTTDIRKFLFFLTDKGYAKATIFTHQKELRVFFNFLADEGLVEENPMANIKRFKMPTVYPYVLSETEVQKLLKAAKGKSFEAKRNCAMISLFVDTGLRVSELVGLKLEKINFASLSIRVIGKGEKERTVLFGRDTAKALSAYMKARPNTYEDRLFITRAGNPLTRRAVLQILHRIAVKAGLEDRRVCPHTLRHTFATLYIKRGGSPFVLQRLLGHSDIKTVMVYVNLVGKDLRDDYFSHNPLG